MDTITLLGKDWKVKLPGLAAREEISLAWDESAPAGRSRLFRAASAALGLCTPLGRRAGADYAAHKCDPYSYGGWVYEWLREQGLTHKQILDAARPLISFVSENLAPREQEVAAKAGFTQPPAVDLTG